MPINAPSLRLAADKAAVVILTLLILLGGCGSTTDLGTPPGEIRIIGSDTMLPLNRLLATRFMTTHKNSIVVVEGGGTAVGVDALIAGRADLCAASRPLQPDEIERLFARRGTLGIRTLVALDGVAIYVHPDNPVDSLSLEQLSGLFDGRITRWQGVGGDDRPVQPVIRPPSSGTHRFFKNHVLGGEEYAAAARTEQRTSEVIDAVAAEPGAIGFGGLAYGGAVRLCPVEGHSPDAEALRDGLYPLARYLYLYAVEPPRGLLDTFLTWVDCPEAQVGVAEVGLVPLWPDQ